MQVETTKLDKEMQTDIITQVSNVVANIETVEEAKEGYEKLKALVSYFSRDYNQAYELAVQMCECACKGGEILAESVSIGNPQWSQGDTIVLSDIGITKSQSSRWQKMASIDEEIREQYYDKCLDKEELPTNAGLLKIAKTAKRRQKKEEQQAVINTIEVPEGDWTKLGNHLLFCGDTSKTEFWQSIPQAAFAFADPPYNADADEWDNDFNWDHDWLIKKAPIVCVTPGISSIQSFFQNNTTMPYSWSMAIWIKNGMTRGNIGFGNWIYAAIFSNDSIYRNAQDFMAVTIKTSQTDVTSHKGRKPLDMIINLIELFTEPGDIIIDPFLGSGTTLLAAEHTGRQCIGGEINQEFCKEIIYRYENDIQQK